MLFLLVTAALLGSGFGNSSAPVGPGDKIGTMTVVRGIEHKADAELWGPLGCDPVIPTPGRFRRTCTIPTVRRLFIGWGEWERTTKALDSVWKQLKWDLWLDGRHINLARFGTSERTLHYFPPAGGKDAILREWSVVLVGATPGKHVIRYRSASRSLGTTDTTWTFIVR